MTRGPAIFLATCAIALAACGDGSSTPTSTAPPLSLHVCDKLISGSLAISVAPTDTRRVANPKTVAKARQLLKPLTVANTLKVGPNNQAAGGLVAGLYGELDNIYPGLLTKETANGSERLNVPVVNRFLRYAPDRAPLVDEPKVAQGVKKLDGVLRGKPPNFDISSCGGGLTTAASVVAEAEGETSRYWPALSKQLTALRASLR